MSAHTPEPWILERCYDGALSICQMRHPSELYCINSVEGAEPSGYEATESNGARIVSCVNACAGMTDPAAEIQALREAVDFGQATVLAADMFAEKNAEIAALKKSKAELLDLIEDFKGIGCEHYDMDMGENGAPLIERAEQILKAEGRAE